MVSGSISLEELMHCTFKNEEGHIVQNGHHSILT